VYCRRRSDLPDGHHRTTEEISAFMEHDVMPFARPCSRRWSAEPTT
jgi:hypothetical protein